MPGTVPGRMILICEVQKTSRHVYCTLRERRLLAGRQGNIQHAKFQNTLFNRVVCVYGRFSLR